MALRIKRGDKVQVIRGKDRGKSGKVLRTVSDGKRVIVEGINTVRKHLRRRSEAEPGGVKDIPAAIDISNVLLFCSSCNKGVRFGVKVMDDKTKARICSRCDKPL